MTTKSPTLHTIGLKHIPVGKLFANPYNPRMLFDKKPLGELKDSIKRNKVLVPLTVYWDEAKERWIILDGQRRWICAQEVGLKTVPANEVAPPGLVENIVTMFQIHKLREDWELMPTALKVELLMEKTGDRRDSGLAALTGLDEAVIQRCKKLLWYDRKYQDMMLVEDPDQRIKADFFIELYPVITDRDIKGYAWFRKNRFIELMLGKYIQDNPAIKAVTDFRRVKQYTTAARKIGAMEKFSTKLKEFVEQPDVPITHLEIVEATTHAEALKLSKTIGSLGESLKGLDVDEFYGEDHLWDAVESLISTLESVLKKADKRRR